MTKDQIIELYNMGKKSKQIAIETSVSERTVLDILKKYRDGELTYYHY